MSANRGSVALFRPPYVLPLPLGTAAATDDSFCGDSGARLLLLEDDIALRHMLEWELSEHGYRVIAVSSCHEARSAAAEQDFDLGLFDIGLPDGDGAELAAELIGQRPEMQIVLCSGRMDAYPGERLPPEVRGCLTKPVSIDRLDAIYRTPYSRRR